MGPINDDDDDEPTTADGMRQKIATLERLAHEEADADEIRSAGRFVREADEWRERLATLERGR